MNDRAAVIAAYEAGEFYGTDYEGAWNLGFDTTDLKNFSVWKAKDCSALCFDGMIEFIDETGSTSIYDLESKEWKE